MAILNPWEPQIKESPYLLTNSFSVDFTRCIQESSEARQECWETTLKGIDTSDLLKSKSTAGKLRPCMHSEPYTGYKWVLTCGWVSGKRVTEICLPSEEQVLWICEVWGKDRRTEKILPHCPSTLCFRLIIRQQLSGAGAGEEQEPSLMSKLEKKAEVW